MDSEPVVLRHAIAAMAAGGTDIGRREHNEDHILLRPELGLYLLADGAGGHNAGNVASALATTTVANVYETSAKSLAERPEVDGFGLWTMARRLATAIQRANVEVIEVAKKTEKYQGMGTTLVALAFSDDGHVAHVAHVGDSRCYRLRAGLLEPLTVDHSLLVDVLETHPDADDALLSRMPRHVVTRALGMEEGVRVSTRSLRVLAGDMYLLCSDGLSDVLDEERLETVLCEAGAPEDHVRSLVSLGLSTGGRDNLAAVVVACHEADVAPTRRPSLRPSDPPPRPSQRLPYSSAPEIIIVGVESHVVPAQSANANLLDALGRFARLRPVRSAAHVEPTDAVDAEPTATVCAHCGRTLPAETISCPACGAGAG